MTDRVHLTPLDPRYPSRLRAFESAPVSMTVEGGSTEALAAVAIVGTRHPTRGARLYALRLAETLAKAGVVVVSGGACGIDGAAHRGALGVGGRTWAVAPTGHEFCYPGEHASLFAEIARGPGAMIWPFPPRYTHRSSFHARNRVLVALSDAVVVVQAGFRSGALNAASWARRLNRALWVVPVPPWAAADFTGSRQLIESGALPLTSTHLLLDSLGLLAAEAAENRSAVGGLTGPPSRGLLPPAPLDLSDREFKVLVATSTEPCHADAIATSAGMSPQATTAALLTLALENVVVEGPPGFFCRRGAHNR
jgi:DNA processing protein